ncbi:MAG: DNA mismatch repair protein MutS [Deltaproteobacteria bacterium]|nr:DNA mismatch repair protein MutS [Deltaproteobacteria bacterium]
MTRFRGGPPQEPEDAPPPEPIHVPITDVLDLHDFHPREVLPVTEAYLEAAREKGLVVVRLIHGKGKGVQRARLHQLLREHPDVADFEQAPAEHGGWGATRVQLREGPDTR